jgi:hypothetical protein
VALFLISARPDLSNNLEGGYFEQICSAEVYICKKSAHISMTSTGDHESSFDLALSDQNKDLLRAEDLLRG